MTYLVSLASLTIFFQIIFNLSNSVLIGFNRMDQSAILTGLYQLVRLIATSMLLALGLGVVGAVVGNVFGVLVSGLFGATLYVLHYIAVRPQQERDGSFSADVKPMVVFGLPLYVASVIHTLTNQYQNIVLAFFMTNNEIGNFGAALNFGVLIGVVGSPMTVSLFPAFSKIDSETGRGELRKLFEVSVKYTTTIIAPTVTAIAVLSKDLILAVYGNAFTLAPLYLGMYVTVFFLAAIGYNVLSSLFNGLGKSKENLKLGLIHLGVFLPMAPLLSLSLRVPGVIIAMVLSTLISTGYGLNLAVRRYGMGIDLKGSLLTLLASLMAGVPTCMFTSVSTFPSLANVLLGASIYLLAYLTLAPLLHVVTLSDLHQLRPILLRIRFLKPIVMIVFEYEKRIISIAN